MLKITKNQNLEAENSSSLSKTQLIKMMNGNETVIETEDAFFISDERVTTRLYLKYINVEFESVDLKEELNQDDFLTRLRDGIFIHKLTNDECEIINQFCEQGASIAVVHDSEEVNELIEALTPFNFRLEFENRTIIRFQADWFPNKAIYEQAMKDEQHNKFITSLQLSLKALSHVANLKLQLFDESY